MALYRARRSIGVLATISGLTLAVTTMTATGNPTAAQPRELAGSSPNSGRVPELATATSDTYRQPDGSYHYVGYTTPVNYLADDGVWMPIDNELVPTPGDTYAVENAENNYTVKLPEDAGSSPVKITTDNQWLTFEMNGLEGSPVVGGTVATYTQADAAEAGEVIYEARADGVKESIVLDHPPTAAVEYTFDLRLSAGLTPHLGSTGEIDVIDAAKRVVFTLPAPFMTDADHAISTNVSYELAQTATGWQLVVNPSDVWLQDPARAYPVVVDPTVTKTPSTDGWIAEASPTQVNAGGAYLRVGGTAGSRRRALLRFDVASIPADAVITSSTLKLHLDAGLTTGTGSDSTGLIAGRVKSTQTWTPGWLSWNNREYQTPWETSGGSWDSPSPASPIDASISNYKHIDVLQATQRWVNDGWANNGLIVRQDAASDKALWFHSVNTTTENPPKFVATYTVPDHAPATPTNLTITPGGEGYTTSASPTLSATVSDPDGGSVAAHFRVLEAGTEVWAASADPIVSGQRATVTMPEGLIYPGVIYTVSVTAQAGSPTLTSAAATASMQADTSAPAPASATCSIPCIPFDPIPTVFDAPLTNDATVDLTGQLPVADILDVGMVRFELQATTGATPSTVTMYSPDDAKPLATTVTVPANTTRTVRVNLWPSGDNHVALSPNGGSLTNLRLRPIGWEQWDDASPDDPVNDPALYDLPDGPISEFDQAEDQRVPVELSAREPAEVDPVDCQTDATGDFDLCVTDYETFEAYRSAIAQDTSQTLAEREAAAAQLAPIANCAEYPRYSSDRNSACTRKGLRFTWRETNDQDGDGVDNEVKGRAHIQLTFTLRLKPWEFLEFYDFKIKQDSGSGWGRRLAGNFDIGGYTDWRPHEIWETGVNEPPWAGSLEAHPNGGVDMQPGQVEFSWATIYLKVGGIGTPTTKQRDFFTPEFRCDRLPYLSKGRGAGCTFHHNRLHVDVSLDRFKESTRLIYRAQEGRAQHYGQFGYGKPVTRLVNRTAIRANRRKARNRCRTVFPNGLDYTCDEYPLAMTRQGCKMRPGLCTVGDVPGEQNSGSGGKIGNAVHYWRVFDGEGFYIDVVP